jgi:hypothetical protein
MEVKAVIFGGQKHGLQKTRRRAIVVFEMQPM